MENNTRADSRKYHFIYKTTCKTTGKWYIGLHSTNIVEDCYLGSGIKLAYSIRKYGKENHTREILEFCESREAVKLREKEIVNEELLKNAECLNIVLGGNAPPEVTGTTRQRMSESGKKRAKEKPELAETKAKRSATMKGNRKLAVWEGKKLSDEHRAAISAGVTGMTMSEEAKKKISDAHKGKVHTEEHRINNSKAQSKSYLIEYEDGRKEVISNLMHWCIDNGISNSPLRLSSAEDKFFNGVKLRHLDGSTWISKAKKRLSAAR